jgi:hypothetical protein
MKQSPFEIFLDRLDPDDRGNQLVFFRILAASDAEVVRGLEGRVQKVSCPFGLKQLTVEAAYYFPWPEWAPVIERLLRHEKSLDLFETGVRALGRIRSPQALACLKVLSFSRVAPGFREIVNEVLLETDPAGAFQHHFARLLQGSTQAAEANEGAHQLARLLSPESLGPLQEAVRHPDPLIFRHALHLVGQIPTPEAASFLLGFLQDCHRDSLEDREARADLATFRALPRPEVQARALQDLATRYQERDPGAAAELVSGEAARILGAVATLREAGPGLLDAFLLDTLLAAMDDKPAVLGKVLGQAGEGTQQRTRRIDFAVDSSAQSLAAMALAGYLEPGELLPVLAESLRRGTGSTGVAGALAQLVPAERQDLLDLLLNQPEGALRLAALEILGGRRDEAFRSSLLKLRRDPITDIADRSLWHLGQLADPEGLARTLLAHSDPEEVLVALRYITLHRLAGLIPELVALAGGEARESILIAALETLGGTGSTLAVEPLLALLHSGQGPRIQVAVAEALRDLGVGAGALELCARAKALNAPILHVLAVEALARAYESAEQPLPSWESDTLVQAVRGGWHERNPWPLRRRIGDALVAIHVQEPGVLGELSSLIQATLAEKRQPGSVAPEDLAHLQACARTLAQKAHA